MAKNIKSTRSLHIQNDQTDDAGVYQRNSGADLFMEAPGGMQEFTNFNDKVASSNDGEDPANAFTKSPYYDSVESMFGSTGLIPTDKDNAHGFGRDGALGQTLDNAEFSVAINTRLVGGGDYLNTDGYVKSASLLTRTERSGAIPSDIKILDDIAVVSYRNHSQESYLANIPAGDGFVIIKVVYDNTGATEVLSRVETVRGVSFADLGTSAVTQQEFLGRGNSGIYAQISNAGLEAGYNICFEGAVASALGLGPTVTTVGGECALIDGDTWRWTSGEWAQISTGACDDATGCVSTPPAYDGSMEGETANGTCGPPSTTVSTPLCYTEETTSIKTSNGGRWRQHASDIKIPRDRTGANKYREEAPPAELVKVVNDTLYYNRSQTKKGYTSKQVQGLNIDIGAGRDRTLYPDQVINGITQPSEATLFTLCARTDAELIWTALAEAEGRDGPFSKNNNNYYYYKVPVKTTSDSFFYKKGRANRCGRVDIYERRKGSITAVSGNKITVTGPTGDGTYDTELLQDGR